MSVPGSSDPARALWEGLVRAQALALPRVHRELRRQHGLSLSEYTVLHQVAATGEVGATMTALQATACMSAAGITRVAAALSARQLVDLSRREHDRRLTYVRLTARGRLLLPAAEKTLDGELALLVGERTDSDAIATTARVLQALGNAAL